MKILITIKKSERGLNIKPPDPQGASTCGLKSIQADILFNKCAYTLQGYPQG